jgi:hypothetical protein
MAQTGRGGRDHEAPSPDSPPAPQTQLRRPAAPAALQPAHTSAPIIRPNFVQGEPPRSTRNIPFEDTDISLPPQHTATLAGGATMTFIHPRKYANPSFTCSIFNVGPGMVSARWDGPNAIFGAPECVLLPPMTGYAEATTMRMSIAADGTGATVSISAENYYG